VSESPDCWRHDTTAINTPIWTATVSPLSSFLQGNSTTLLLIFWSHIYCIMPLKKGKPRGEGQADAVEGKQRMYQHHHRRGPRGNLLLLSLMCLLMKKFLPPLVHDTFTTRLQPVADGGFLIMWYQNISVTGYERVVNVFIQCDRFHNVFIPSSYRSTPSSCRLLAAGASRPKFWTCPKLSPGPTGCK